MPIKERVRRLPPHTFTDCVFYVTIQSMFESFLQEIGLSEKESQIYLALLQYDTASINELTTKTKINRTTIYPVLESLQKKGLVSEAQDGKKTSYQAAPPERLETYIERQKVVLEEQERRLKDIIPQIKSIQREQGERPIVKLFQGRDGAIAAYEEFYNTNSRTDKVGYFLFDQNAIVDTFTETERDKFRIIRTNNRVYPYTIYNDKKQTALFKTPGDRIKIDKDTYPIKIDMSIIDDSIVITTIGETIVSLVIKSTDIAETFKSIFRYIHDKSKKAE